MYLIWDVERVSEFFLINFIWLKDVLASEKLNPVYFIFIINRRLTCASYHESFSQTLAYGAYGD